MVYTIHKSREISHSFNKAIGTDMAVLIRSQHCRLYDEPKKINK